MRNIGVSTMHRIRCLTASAEGGFKTNNGLPKMGKGPMANEGDLKSSNEASLPQPTQAGRIELCTELIRHAKKCLENNDKDCVLRKIEELVRADCHNGHAVGKETADKVRELIHELWLVSNNERRCELLTILRDLGISKGWVKEALHMTTKMWNKWLRRCGIEWEGKVTRNNVVKDIEGLLREKFGWNEIRMCERLWKFIDVDVNEFKRYGIDVCDWLYVKIDEIYFIGIVMSDVGANVIRDAWGENERVMVSLRTTNSIDALFFSILLHKPSIAMTWCNTSRQRKIITVEYYIYVKKDKWRWIDNEELIKNTRALRPEDVPKLIAGVIDGDGTIKYNFTNSMPFIEIAACKACRKRVFLDALQEALRKLRIDGKIYELDHEARLEVYGENAIKLLRLIMPYLRHPLRRLRAKLILMLYEGRIDYETFTELYEQTEYEDENDPKRSHAVEALARAAPQTHTHGDAYWYSTKYINSWFITAKSSTLLLPPTTTSTLPLTPVLASLAVPPSIITKYIYSLTHWSFVGGGEPLTSLFRLLLTLRSTPLIRSITSLVSTLTNNTWSWVAKPLCRSLPTMAKYLPSGENFMVETL